VIVKSLISLFSVQLEIALLCIPILLSVLYSLFSVLLGLYTIIISQLLRLFMYFSVFFAAKTDRQNKSLRRYLCEISA